jgi:hypothetical protein
MKTKLGTSLALAAVLATGTAAAAINTQSLNKPTESKLGTVSNALLPVNQTAVVIPAQPQTTPVAPSQNQATTIPAPQLGVSSTPTTSTPVPTNPTNSATSAPSSPSVKYGNPNPATGRDDNNGDDGHTNFGQDHDGDDD